MFSQGLIIHSEPNTFTLAQEEHQIIWQEFEFLPLSAESPKPRDHQIGQPVNTKKTSTTMSVERSESETFSVPGGLLCKRPFSAPHFTDEHWELSSGKAGYGVFLSLGANRLVILIWLYSISGEPEMPGVHCVCCFGPFAVPSALCLVSVVHIGTLLAPTMPFPETGPLSVIARLSFLTM